MAMQSQLWSISALATELKMDRRTLAKRLEYLTPAEEKKTGKRIQKRWRLSDVVEHLKNPMPQQAEIDEKMKELTKEYLSKQLFPLISNNPTFIGTILSNAMVDGLSKQKALSAYKTAVFAIMATFSDITGDDDLVVEARGHFELLIEKGDDEFIKNHWPKWADVEIA